MYAAFCDKTCDISEGGVLLTIQFFIKKKHKPKPLFWTFYYFIIILSNKYLIKFQSVSQPFVHNKACIKWVIWERERVTKKLKF